MRASVNEVGATDLVGEMKPGDFKLVGSKNSFVTHP